MNWPTAVSHATQAAALVLIVLFLSQCAARCEEARHRPAVEAKG